MRATIDIYYICFSTADTLAFVHRVQTSANVNKIIEISYRCNELLAKHKKENHMIGVEVKRQEKFYFFYSKIVGKLCRNLMRKEKQNTKFVQTHKSIYTHS